MPRAIKKLYFPLFFPLLLLLIFSLSACASINRNNTEKYTKTGFYLDTVVSLTVYSEADAAYRIQEQQQRKTIEVTSANANIAKAEREAELKAREVEVKKQTLDAEIRAKADAEAQKTLLDVFLRRVWVFAPQKKNGPFRTVLDLSLTGSAGEPISYELIVGDGSSPLKEVEASGQYSNHTIIGDSILMEVCIFDS